MTGNRDLLASIGGSMLGAIGWANFNQVLAALATVGSLVMFGLSIYDRFKRKRSE